MKKCWDKDSSKRPTSSEVFNIIKKWRQGIKAYESYEYVDEKLKNDIMEFLKADEILDQEQPNVSTMSEYGQDILDQCYGLCPNYNHANTYWDYCQVCNSKRFQKEFNKWSSGNEHVDKFIQDAQLKARNPQEILEWIPYNNLSNIRYLAIGGFSIIYEAIWLDGWIKCWDDENKQWKRTIHSLKSEDYENAKDENIKSPLNENEKYGLQVVLKSLNNSSNINEEFLNEVIV